MKQNETKNPQNPQNPKMFFCVCCEYITSNKKDFSKHVMTPKHQNYVILKQMKQMKQKIPKNPQKSPELNCCCGCSFNSRTTLWRHKKKCEILFVNKLDTDKDKEKDKELIMNLIKENIELKNMVLDVCQKIQPLNNVNYNNINSNNKTFNLNIFLNEHCKDAMNITDFVDSLKIQLTDLESVGKLGFVNGISNIIVKNLNSLDETKRPIHCTDTKREILYIKDKDKWEKENETNNNIRKVIKKVVDKNVRLIPEFKEEHPDCIKSTSKYSDQYNKIIVESMGGHGDNETEKEDKIIKNIAKEVTIDKKLY